MRQDVLKEMAALLAKELDGGPNDLDDLEGQVLQAMHQVGQDALQQTLAGKKGATSAAGSLAGADPKPGS